MDGWVEFCPEEPTKLQGQVALVTGAASGIARAVALRFASEGTSVVVADGKVEAGKTVAQEISNAGGRAIFAELDVSQAPSVDAVVKSTLEAFGGLNILFNGAGILAYGDVTDTTEATWQKILAVNLTGTFLCCKAVLPHMVQQKKGTIINVASTTGAHDACARAAAYVSSKGGVTLLTRSMAIDYAKKGVRVNAICPGPTDTPMLRQALTPEQLDAFAKTFPMGRLGRPEEIAGAAVFLASDDASFVTGAMLYVDGGQAAEV